MGSWIFAMIGILLIIDTGNHWQFVFAISVDSACECGISGEGISTRIVGGKISTPHMFPWVVAIFNKKSLHCGGSLINDRYVLTAGHCTKWTDIADLSLGFGLHDIKKLSAGFEVPIAAVINHPDFESDYLHDTNDIALIKMKYPIRFSENVRPVCMPTRGDHYVGLNAQVAGWGRVTTNGGASRFLRQTTLKVMSVEACRNTSYGDHITSSMICAYNDNTDACQGDSGGPLMLRRYSGTYETIGTISWGIGCAQKYNPGVYVRNGDYLTWIYRNTNDAVYCHDRH